MLPRNNQTFFSHAIESHFFLSLRHRKSVRRMPSRNMSRVSVVTKRGKAQCQFSVPKVLRKCEALSSRRPVVPVRKTSKLGYPSFSVWPGLPIDFAYEITKLARDIVIDIHKTFALRRSLRANGPTQAFDNFCSVGSRQIFQLDLIVINVCGRRGGKVNRAGEEQMLD